MGRIAQLAELEACVPAVARFGPELARLADAELPARTEQLRARLAGGEALSALLPEAFALVREVTRRTRGRGHSDVQLVAAAAMHRGCVAAVRVGEDPVLTMSLAAYLDALAGTGVHVVHADEAAARRARDEVGDVYRALGVDVGLVEPGMDAGDRRAAYRADVSYGSYTEFGFDYVRDNLCSTVDDQVQRSRCVALIDLIHSVLVDEAQAPLMVTHLAKGSPEEDRVVLGRVTVAGYFRLYDRVGGLSVGVDPSPLAILEQRWGLAVVPLHGEQVRRRLNVAIFSAADRLARLHRQLHDEPQLALDYARFDDDTTTLLYALRGHVLTASWTQIDEMVRGLLQSVAQETVATYCRPTGDTMACDIDGLVEALSPLYSTPLDRGQLDAGSRDSARLVQLVADHGQRAYEEYLTRLEAQFTRAGQRPEHAHEVARKVMLRVIDNHWRTYLAGSRERAWSLVPGLSQDAMFAGYRRRSTDAFNALLALVRRDTVRYMFHVEVAVGRQGPAAKSE